MKKRATAKERNFALEFGHPTNQLSDCCYGHVSIAEVEMDDGVTWEKYICEDCRLILPDDLEDY